jgi:tetratricopeptide (TPR) repeat protein
MAKLARLPTVGDAAAAEAPDNRIPRLRTRYYAFLSYSHQDRELANWLHRELENFRVPLSLAGRLTVNGVVPRRLTPIFRDQHDLSAADDLAVEVEAALAASQFLLVLCSPIAAKSRWMNVEIESFKRTRPEGCVLAAVVSGEPFASEVPGREDDECFPAALRFKYDRRGHRTGRRAEPLAADFREVGEGRRLAFLKLVAGMLGVGLDELVRREQTRRHRRLAILTAASLAGMAVTSALAVTAIQARNSAREQRSQAERLVEFMVGDLRDKLEPIGKLDLLDDVGTRVLAYYSKQDASELSDDSLVQRSRALNLMAEVAYNRGNLAEAEALYQQAEAGTAEAVRRAPNDPKQLFAHAQNVFYVGEVARFAGRPQQAEASYRQYKRIADRMVELEPDNLKYRMEVLYANEDVGISVYDQHRYREAVTLFEGAAVPMEKLSAVYPDDRTYEKEYATALAWAADAHRGLGDLEGATAIREKQIATLDQLMRAAPGTNVQARLVPAHEGLGIVLGERGEFERALQELQAGVDEGSRLIATDAENADWKIGTARARLDLAGAYLSAGRLHDASAQSAAACAMAAALPPSFDISFLTQLHTTCAFIRARLALAAKETGQAAIYADQALRSSRSEHSESPISDRFRVATMYRLVGDVREAAGAHSAAMEAWSAGLAEIPSNVAERPSEMNEHAQLLRSLGRAEEAAPLTKRLKSIGYDSGDEKQARR